MTGPSINNTTSTTCISEKPNGVEEPVESFILRAVIMSLILFLAFVGNIILYRSATKMSNRPFTYNLVSNLALAEIVLTVSYPFLFHYTCEPWSWVFGEFMCKVVNPLVMCSTLVITFTLAVIALYRCLILIQPRKQRPSKRTAYQVILCSWIWGVALSMPAFITRSITEVEVCGPKILLLCLEVFPNSETSHNYSIALFVLQFVLPFLVMVFSYGIVIFKVKKHMKKTRQQTEIVHEADDGNGIPLSTHMSRYGKSGETPNNELNNKTDRRESNRIQHLESDLLKMIYIIILIFFLCYLPSHIVFISGELEWFSLKDWKYEFILWRYTDILHALPSALHPMCYGYMSKVLAVKPCC